MTARVTRRGHSVALLDADGAEDLALFRNDIVLAGLGSDLARCQFFHCVIPPPFYYVEFWRKYS